MRTLLRRFGFQIPSLIPTAGFADGKEGWPFTLLPYPVDSVVAADEPSEDSTPGSGTIGLTTYYQDVLVAIQCSPSLMRVISPRSVSPSILPSTSRIAVFSGEMTRESRESLTRGWRAARV